MSGIAAIGGGATSFQPLPSLTVNLLPPMDYPSSSLLANCAQKAQQLQKHRHDLKLPQSYDGSNREGALYCRSGNWMEILDKTAADDAARRSNSYSRPEYVRGTRTENSRFSVLEFISIAFGLVSIRGKESNRYLCMDRDGTLYASLEEHYSSECVFMEEMLENYYNLYSSCSYGTRKKPWYIALRRNGKTRKGKNARKRRKSSHFLVVHFDGAPSENGYNQANGAIDGSIHLSNTRPYRYGNNNALMPSGKYEKPPLPRNLNEILPGTLISDSPITFKPTNLLDIARRKNNILDHSRATLQERRARKRRRKARLEREERKRQLRRDDLEMKRNKANREAQLRELRYRKYQR